MPIEEMLLNMLLVVLAFSGILGVTGMFLSHRRKMAEIKHGRSDRETALSKDNSDLRETVGMMQDRLAVLEQIAIDPARRTAEEIEKLR